MPQPNSQTGARRIEANSEVNSVITGRSVLLAPLSRMQGRKKTDRRFPPEERFGIVVRETEELVGEINYCNYSPYQREVEIGIEIDSAGRGKGYGEDALYHFLDYLFFVMRVEAVKLAVMVNNQPAYRLYQKLGFQDLELIRGGGYDVEDEQLVDVRTMLLVEEQWRARRREYSFKQPSVRRPIAGK